MKPTAEFSEASVPARRQGAVQAEVDGEMILLSPKDYAYFGAQGEGATVWSLVDGHRNVGMIIAELEATFDAEPGVIRADTVEFLHVLAAAGLIEFV